MTLQELMSKQWIVPISGALGALVWFLLGIKRGHFKNNRYLVKVLTELFGGMITATFASLLFTSEIRTVAAFACGLTWADVLQRMRIWVTEFLRKALDQSNRDQDLKDAPSTKDFNKRKKYGIERKKYGIEKSLEDKSKENKLKKIRIRKSR